MMSYPKVIVTLSQNIQAMQYSKYRSLYLALIHILALVAMGCKNDLKKDVETLEKQALKLQKEEQALQNKNAVLLGNKKAMDIQNDLETLEKKSRSSKMGNGLSI